VGVVMRFVLWIDDEPSRFQLLQGDWSYGLILHTPKGEEVIVSGEKDPRRIHRIATGKSFTKRVSRFGCSFNVTRDNRNMKFEALEDLCFQLWLEDNDGRDRVD
jgi:hypothetical protein